MFKCVSSSNEVRSFQTFAECQRFVRHEGDHSRLWSYLGLAQLSYIASLERV